MMPSRAKSGRSGDLNMNSQGALKASRFNRNGSAPARPSLPPSKPCVSVHRPTKSFELKVSSKNSTSPNSQRSELQEKLEAVEIELEKTRGELSESKKLADEMNEELEKATVARARTEEILDTERFRMVELEEELREELAASLNSMADELQKTKALHESELASTGKEAKEKIQKLEAETAMLKLELERARIAEEKLLHMELLVEKLQIEATDARNGESEWRNKAEVLKEDLEEAYQSEKSASDSLADMMVKLEETESLFEEAKREISILTARINSSEIELEESSRQLDLARQDALNIGKTVELLKLELKRLEEEKSEENRKLTDELKLSNDEREKTSKAMKSMFIESEEKEERFARMQSEIEESHKEIEHLSRVLRNTEERYEVMIDEARYELVCLQNREEAKEKKKKNFIDTVRELEELVELHENESTEDAVEMLSKLQQIISCSNSSPEEEEEQSEKDHEESNTKMENGSSEIPFKEQEDRLQEDEEQKGEVNPIEDEEWRMNGTEQDKVQRRKKKKALLYNFGNLLKKGNQ